MDALNKVLDAHPEIPGVYRHLDAALFGGYLPFTEHKDMVNHEKMCFDSIAVSGHKFFGIDSPCGIFLCTMDVYENQNSYNVPYLNNNMRMINCSRDAVQPLKFWWLIHKVGEDGWREQAESMLECTHLFLNWNRVRVWDEELYITCISRVDIMILKNVIVSIFLPKIEEKTH